NFVMDNPGWGIVNHSSNLIASDNVAFHIGGASFASEIGDEMGVYDHNLSVGCDCHSGQGYVDGPYTRGFVTESDGVFIREMLDDWGNCGEGFSLASGTVKLRNNVSASSVTAGYMYVVFENHQYGLPDPTFPAAALGDPSIAKGADTVPIDIVPLQEFYRNEAFATESGFRTYFFNPVVTPLGPSIVDRFLVWNVSNSGLQLDYMSNMTVRGATVLNDWSVTPHGALGVTQNAVSFNFRDSAITFILEDCDVYGWFAGYHAAREGAIVVK